MKQNVNPVLAGVLIVCVVVVIGYFFWKENQDRPIPEGPGSGRIGMTLNLGKTQEQLDAEKKEKGNKEKAGKDKSSEEPKAEKPGK